MESSDKRRRGRPRTEIRVLPPKLVPMTPEEEKAAMNAFARLFYVYLMENPHILEEVSRKKPTKEEQSEPK